MLISKANQFANLQAALNAEHPWVLQAFWRKVKRTPLLDTALLSGDDAALLEPLKEFCEELMEPQEWRGAQERAFDANVAMEVAQFGDEDGYWLYVEQMDAQWAADERMEMWRSEI